MKYCLSILLTANFLYIDVRVYIRILNLLNSQLYKTAEMKINYYTLVAGNVINPQLYTMRPFIIFTSNLWCQLLFFFSIAISQEYYLVGALYPHIITFEYQKRATHICICVRAPVNYIAIYDLPNYPFLRLFYTREYWLPLFYPAREDAPYYSSLLCCVWCNIHPRL